MASLESILTRLQKELPGADEVDEDSLYEMNWTMDDILGFGVHLVSCDDGNSASLPPNLKAYFEALRYVQCVNGLMGDVAHDGFLSIFYNGTGADIDILRSELKYFKDPLSTIVEKAYMLLEPVYKFEPETNYVGRSGLNDVHDVIPQSDQEALTKLEDKVEALQEKTNKRAFTMYKKATSAL